jgi:type VI secretion system secreted protein VgrG
MASAVEVKITINGDELKGFKSLSVRQNIQLHHTFDLSCRTDAFKRFTEIGQSFVIESAQDFIGKKVTIELVTIGPGKAKTQSSVIFKGIILEVLGTKYEDAFSGTLIFRGSSMDVVFDSTCHCRSFERKSLDDIVRTVLSDYSSNIFDGQHISSRKSGDILYIVQYNETTFEFLQRLAKTYGEWLLVTGDNHLYFGAPPETKYAVVHGKDLHEFSFGMKLNPLKFNYTAYDYMAEASVTQPDSSLTTRPESYLKTAFNASEDIFSNEGNVYYNYPLSKEGPDDDVKNAVKTDKRSRIAALNIARGSSDNFELKLGNIVKIEGIGGAEGSDSTTSFGDYRIISLSHACDEGGNYRNHFEAVPVSIEVPPQCDPLNHPTCDIQSAKVTDTNDPDGLGRIRVRFYWQPASDKSPWLRVMTPYAGKNKGYFFIPEVDEEVLIGFEDNNAEKPFVMGAHYNGKNKPDDWKTEKNTKKAIRTNSGHTIEFNDEQGKEEIIIYDKDKVNTITLSSHGKLLTIVSKGDLKVEAEKMDFTAHKDFTVKVEGKIDISSMKDTEINATGKCTIKTNQDLSLEAMANLKAKATANAEISGAMLAAKGSGTAELSAGGVTTIKGSIVKIN